MTQYDATPKQANRPQFNAEQRLVAVTTLTSHDQIDPLAHSMLKSGLQALEITLRTDVGLLAIRELSAIPGLVIGAGTVLNDRQADAAVAAGAAFVVTPGVSRSVAESCAEQACPLIPGAATATEVMMALDLGLHLVKFFPAEPLGGVDMLRALTAPFPDVRFMPTGGVTIDNLLDYLSLSAVVAIGGSWMVAPELLRDHHWQQVQSLTEAALVRVRSLTHPQGSSRPRAEA